MGSFVNIKISKRGVLLCFMILSLVACVGEKEASEEPSGPHEERSSALVDSSGVDRSIAAENEIVDSVVSDTMQKTAAFDSSNYRYQTPEAKTSAHARILEINQTVDISPDVLKGILELSPSGLLYADTVRETYGNVINRLYSHNNYYLGNIYLMVSCLEGEYPDEVFVICRHMTQMNYIRYKLTPAGYVDKDIGAGWVVCEKGDMRVDLYYKTHGVGDIISFLVKYFKNTEEPVRHFGFDFATVCILNGR